MELLLFELKNVFSPELILFAFIAINFLSALLFGKKIYKFSGRFALLAVILPLAFICLGISHSGYTIFSENYIQTNFTILIKILILLGAFFTILLSQNITKRLRHKAFEYYTLILIATFASMCLVSSNDFIPLIVALETLSVSCCLLIAFWNKYRAKEASVKFLINSSVALGFLLFGISFLYGISGELNFTLLNTHYYAQDSSILFIISSVFIISGLVFQAGCIPFQRWMPDIFQGSPYPVSAYLSVVPPIAVLAVTARIIGNLMNDAPLLQFIISFMAILTIAYGLIGLIRQTNIKRFLGYSSVAQCGFLLLAISIFTNAGISSFLYYAIILLFTNFGAWAAGITFVSCTGTDEIKDYSGLFYTRPYYTTAFTICLISLAGLPPVAGFLSKVYLFANLIRIDLSGLPFVAISVLIMIFGIYGYINLIRIMFEKTPQTNSLIISEKMNIKAVLYFCTFMIIITCFFANKLIGLSMFASIGI